MSTIKAGEFERLFKENKYTIYDVCESCKRESYDYEVIVINGEKHYRCPSCGRID